MLYHATFDKFLKSIMKNGLGATKKVLWDDSKPGVVYLAFDPDVVESYAELVQDDHQQLDADEEASTLEYHGIISPSLIKIIGQSL